MCNHPQCNSVIAKFIVPHSTKFSRNKIFTHQPLSNFHESQFRRSKILLSHAICGSSVHSCCYCSVVTCLAWVISFFGSELPLSVAFPLFTGACQRCSRLPVGRCNGCQRKSPRQIHQSGGIHFEITVETIFLPYKGQKCME